MKNSNSPEISFKSSDEIKSEKKPIQKDLRQTLAVAFDMDGLMFDTEVVYWNAADELLRRRGFQYTVELSNQIMGRPPKYCFEKMIEVHHLKGENWQAMQKESEDIFVRLLDDGFGTMPGLFSLLDELERRNIPKCVCTSSAKRVADEILSRKNVQDRFDFVITSDDIQNGKPAPDIYQKAAHRFGVLPSKMLVFEDSQAGCRSAKAAECDCIVVLAPHNQNLDFPLADLIVPSLDAPEVFKRLTEMSLRKNQC